MTLELTRSWRKFLENCFSDPSIRCHLKSSTTTNETETYGTSKSILDAYRPEFRFASEMSLYEDLPAPQQARSTDVVKPAAVQAVISNQLSSSFPGNVGTPAAILRHSVLAEAGKTAAELTTATVAAPGGGAKSLHTPSISCAASSMFTSCLSSQQPGVSSSSWTLPQPSSTTYNPLYPNDYSTFISRKRPRSPEHRFLLRQREPSVNIPASAASLSATASASASAPSRVSNAAQNMMVRMGWAPGSGLGASSQGRLEPVRVLGNRGRSGLGGAALIDVLGGEVDNGNSGNAKSYGRRLLKVVRNGVLSEGCTLLLRNVAIPGTEFDEVVRKNVRELCAKFGAVTNVKLRKGGNGLGQDDVEALVFFREHAAAAAALLAIDGKMLAGRMPVRACLLGDIKGMNVDSHSGSDI